MYKRFFYSKTRWQVLKSKKGRHGKERKRKGKIKLKREVWDQQAKSLCGVCVATAYWEEPMEFSQYATKPTVTPIWGEWQPHFSGFDTHEAPELRPGQRSKNWNGSF